MTEESQGYRLDETMARNLKSRLRSNSIKQETVCKVASITAKTVRKVLAGGWATHNSITAVVDACLRLLQPTGDAIDADWIRRALIQPKHSQGRIRYQPEVGRERPYINLDLWLHRTGLGPDRRDESISFSDLHSLLEATADEVLLMLAVPGAGKTTLLSEHAARMQSALLAEVETYDGGPPLIWLSRKWEEKTGRSDATFRHALRSGQLVVLLDGLSEGRAVNGEPPAVTWSRIIRSEILRHPGNRVVVSCRQLEYSLPLKIGKGSVPVVRISPVSLKQATEYLHEVLTKRSVGLSVVLKDHAALLTLCEVPIFLAKLAEVYTGGALPTSRADLFRMLIWKILIDEYARHHTLLQPPLISTVDQLRLSKPDAGNARYQDLPEGTFIEALRKLAWRLQVGPRRRLHMPMDEAHQVLGDDWYDLLTKGCALSLLIIDVDKKEVGFEHHLLQEFFVALSVDIEGVQAIVEDRWRPESIEADRIAGTGWEEVALFAAGLSADPSRFVGEIERSNLVLAARSAEEVCARFPESERRRIQERLAERLRDSKYTRNERIAAGKEIRDLGIMGYERVGPAWSPPLATIPGGVYRLGTPNPESLPKQHHAPGIAIGLREVEIAAFGIGVHPVTNAEFGAFVADGAYEDDRWWTTPEARSWRDGRASGAGMRWQLRQNRRMHQDWGKEYIVQHIDIRWTYDEASEMLSRLLMSERDFEEEVLSVYPDGQPAKAPMYWYDPELSSPSQPVVGVNWHEASAYCLWLSHVTGRNFRLLYDSEIEVAARGREERAYAFGNVFDAELANLHPSGIGHPSPIRMFPPNIEGVFDLTGNVWTWTATFDYSDDDVRMVVNGGSYDTSLQLAQSFCRDSNHPSYRDRYVGFRVGASCT